MKKIILLCVALLSQSVFASSNQQGFKKITTKMRQEYLDKYNIRVLPPEKISIVKAIELISKHPNSPSDIQDSQIIQKYLILNDEQKRNGYVKKYNRRAVELFDIEKIAPIHKKKYSKLSSPKGTYLRDKASELKLAYNFYGVPTDIISLNIGFAPFGAYKKNNQDEYGWDGVVQFFKNKNIGNCAFTEHNRYLADAGVELIEELVTYQVNNKPTTILIKGNKQSGYVYRVDWYDEVFSRSLECANHKFYSDFKNKLINMSKKIDSFH